jgi:hypothetical protein
MTTETEPKWKKFLEDNKWTTYLAYQLKSDSNNPKETLLKYEALLTQCSYLSRMAYCPADIFCRMTQHLDVTPNAFNNYIRAIEKIYDKLFNYKCSFDSKYIQEHLEFEKYFNPVGGDILSPQKNGNKVGIVAPKNNTGEVKTVNSTRNKNGNKVGIAARNNPNEVVDTIASAAGGAELNNTKIEDKKPIGFFVQNKEHMNVYLYVHHNPESKFNPKKTLFIAFKGSSSINDFIHDLKSAAKEDLFLSELNEGSNKSGEFEMMERMVGGFNDPLMNPGQDYGSNIAKSQQSNPQKTQPEQLTQNQQNNPQKPVQSTPQSQNKNNKIKPGKGGWGFIHVLKPSIQEICKKIQELLKSHKFERVIITGHSLGGALASLFGYYLKKYNPNLVNVPIHVVTFGACCIFDAPGRNEFNAFLNIADEKSGFTLDRVTSNFDPVIVLPPDLDHPGYTLLRTEFRAFSKTGRTNEIGEIRKMLGLDKGYDGNDLLLSSNFVDLFTNAKDFKGTGKFDTDLYRGKFRIKFGSNAKEQQLILETAMPDANPAEIRKLFNTIESDAGNKRYNNSEQKGGLHNPLSNKKRIPQKLATEEYKKKTETMMPNQIQYSCYKTMTMGFCHASYMGVSYIMVLRLPNIKGGYKAKKEPTKDYTLYQKDGRIFSSASGNYTSNSDCSKVESNVRNNSAPKANSGANPSIINKNGKKSSFMNGLKSGFKGIFKKNNRKNKTTTKKSIGNIEMQPINPKSQNQVNNSTKENPEEENQGGIFSKCSIL